MKRPTIPGSVCDLGAKAEGAWATGRELSAGEDTPVGDWEIAGVPVNKLWTHFPNEKPAFPDDLFQDILDQSGLPGILGKQHASGIPIIREFAEQHITTRTPVYYTSADSVFRLRRTRDTSDFRNFATFAGWSSIDCRVSRRAGDCPTLCWDMNIGFERTGIRHDFTVMPASNTLLDDLSNTGRLTIGMGKIGDIFNHRGLDKVRKVAGNMALLDLSPTVMDDLRDGGFLFSNFVDSDSQLGHRRDVPGYANALEEFDRRCPEVWQS